MDFLRLHLPGLHQALTGLLDSFSNFVSYLMGDEVPTAAGRGAQATKELADMSAERPKRAAEEEAQEALKGLGGSRSEGNGGPAEAGRHQEGSLATEQTWDWREGSSCGSQADRQDTEAWEAAKAARCQEPSAPSEARKKSEAGSVAGQDWSSQAQERQEPDEQEVNRGETLRTWEQEEEEEEVRAREPGVAEGAESERTWPGEPEGKAGVGWQNAVRDGEETEQVDKETVAEETQGPEARGAGRKEEVVVVVRGGQITGAQETWRIGAEATSSREEADHPVIRETEYGAVPGKRTPEDTESVWVLKEASREDWEKEADEKRDSKESLFPRQTQALGTEGVEEGAGDQAAEREAAGSLGSEEEVGLGFEGQADQGRKEDEGKQDSEIRADQARLEEMVQAEEAKEEKGSGWATEAWLPQVKEAKGAEGDADLETTPEARPEKVFTGQRSEEEAQRGQEALRVGWGGLECEITEGQEPELMGGAQSPTNKPVGGQGAKEKLWRALALGKEETEGNLEGDSRYLEYIQPDVQVSEAEAWGNERRRDVEKGNIQEKAEAEEVEEEAAGGQALEAEAERGPESELLEILEADAEWKKGKDTGCGTEEEEALEAENQELGGGCGAGAGAGQSLEDSEARETEDGEVEVAVPQGADRAPRRGWRLEEVALSHQESEDMQTRSSLATKIVEDKAALDVEEAEVEEGPEGEAGDAWEREFKRVWDSEEREEAGGGGELPEAQHGEATEGENRGGQFSLEDSAEEGVMGRGRQAEAFEATEGDSEGDQTKVGESAVAGGSWRIDQFTSGSQVARTEGTMIMGEAEGLPGEQTVEGTEAGEWKAMEQGADSEGQHGDNHPEGEAHRPLDLEDVEVAEGQRPEAEEAGEAKEARKAKEAREAKEAGEAEEVREAEEPGKAGEDKEAEEARVAEETGEAGEAEEAGEVEEAQEAEEAREAEEAGEAEEVNDIEKSDPEGLEDVKGQKEQPITQDPSKAEPELQGETEAAETTESNRGHAHSSWSEALLPGSRLDVSIPRSRSLLSRSSSQHRSRPSFRRTPASGPQEEPPSPAPEAELSAPQQRLLQSVEPPESSPPRPEGTPVPARRRPLGHGFGLAHSGMMQELQARLGQPKPQ
ncbi:apolipoprotein B receptor [Dugong dugon]